MAVKAKNRRKSFKRHLLLGQWLYFKIISQKCFLGDPLLKLLNGSALQNKMAARAHLISGERSRAIMAFLFVFVFSFFFFFFFFFFFNDTIYFPFNDTVFSFKSFSRLNRSVFSFKFDSVLMIPYRPLGLFLFFNDIVFSFKSISSA